MKLHAAFNGLDKLQVCSEGIAGSVLIRCMWLDMMLCSYVCTCMCNIGKCCRLQRAQQQADAATAQACKTADTIQALQIDQSERAARNDLIQRTLVPLQQEIDKITVLLEGLMDVVPPKSC